LQPARHLPATIHPVHAVLLAGTLPLALAALLADWAYAEMRHVQWVNFAAWLTAGTALFAGLTLLWALGAALFGGGRDRQGLIYLLLVLGTFGLAVLDALVHTREAWAVMPEAPVLSVLVALLALAATWAGFARLRTGERR
jgi:uncharacterized membrane protein